MSKSKTRRQAITLAATSAAATAITAAVGRDSRRSRIRPVNRAALGNAQTNSQPLVITGNRRLRKTPFQFEKFSQPLPIPPTKRPLAVGKANAPFTVGDCFHGVAPEYFDRRTAEEPKLPIPERYPEKYYELRMRQSQAEIIPGVSTPIYGFDGRFPGPTLRFRGCEPAVIRVHNDLDVACSMHLHGGHNPSHADGYPNFYVLPGKARDYYYTNSIPYHNGVPDISEAPSTLWYHDHTMDLSAEHVIRGLAGFCIQIDDHEQGLIDQSILPSESQDLPIVIADRRFNRDGTFFFDPLDHNGYLGDVYVLNGKAFPYKTLRRGRYRLRLTNGCTARHIELRLSSGQPFLVIGNDSWLLPHAIEQDTVLLSPGKRADVIVDLGDTPDEFYLENILVQEDGRGPKGKLFRRETQIPGEPLMKFIMEETSTQANCTVQAGDPLRRHTPILESEIEVTRVFEFHRSKGAWQINHEFFDEFKSNACPRIGSAERWILRNKAGGWWHPIHIHLESHQIQKIEGITPPENWKYKTDTTMLGPGTEAEIFMKFRTFTGPFVFHCHTLAHEDMRMMFVFDPIIDGPKVNQPLSAYYP